MRNFKKTISENTSRRLLDKIFNYLSIKFISYRNFELLLCKMHWKEIILFKVSLLYRIYQFSWLLHISFSRQKQTERSEINICLWYKTSYTIYFNRIFTYFIVFIFLIHQAQLWMCTLTDITPKKQLLFKFSNRFTKIYALEFTTSLTPFCCYYC